MLATGCGRVVGKGLRGSPLVHGSHDFGLLGRTQLEGWQQLVNPDAVRIAHMPHAHRSRPLHLHNGSLRVRNSLIRKVASHSIMAAQVAVTMTHATWRTAEL
jgi:hypothetical protein